MLQQNVNEQKYILNLQMPKCDLKPNSIQAQTSRQRSFYAQFKCLRKIRSVFELRFFSRDFPLSSLLSPLLPHHLFSGDVV